MYKKFHKREFMKNIIKSVVHYNKPFKIIIRKPYYRNVIKQFS